MGLFRTERKPLFDYAKSKEKTQPDIKTDKVVSPNEIATAPNRTWAQNEYDAQMDYAKEHGIVNDEVEVATTKMAMSAVDMPVEPEHLPIMDMATTPLSPVAAEALATSTEVKPTEDAMATEVLTEKMSREAATKPLSTHRLEVVMDDNEQPTVKWHEIKTARSTVALENDQPTERATVKVSVFDKPTQRLEGSTLRLVRPGERPTQPLKSSELPTVEMPTADMFQTEQDAKKRRAEQRAAEQVSERELLTSRLAATSSWRGEGQRLGNLNEENAQRLTVEQAAEKRLGREREKREREVQPWLAENYKLDLDHSSVEQIKTVSDALLQEDSRNLDEDDINLRMGAINLLQREAKAMGSSNFDRIDESYARKLVRERKQAA